MTLAEEGRSPREESLLSRPLLAQLTIDWELVAYAGLALFAILTRFWDLGSRALHHDESLHALYSWYLYVGRGYVHDPMMHGPFQFHAVALTYLLLGASDYTARVVPAIFGVWVVIAPYFLRREMGRLAALMAATLFAISPSFLYFSRFIRNDIYMAGWAMLVLIGIFGFLRERRPFYFYLIAIGAAFSYATKETVYITGFVFLLFFVLEALVALLQKRTPIGWSALRAVSGRTWAVSIALFLVINLVLYTTFFTNPRGVISGSTGAIGYWLAQQGVQRGGQPWFYYLLLIPLYEFLPLLVALGGGVFLAVRRQLRGQSLFFWFMVVWLLGTLVIYSWAGEKMPWLELHTIQPLLFLAALGLAGLSRRASRQLFSQASGFLVLALVGLVAAVLLGGLVAAQPPAGTQLGMQASQLQRMAMGLLLIGMVAILVAIGRREGSRTVLVPAALGLVAALLVLTIHTGWGVTYARGDIPHDMLVYVQSSPDVTKVMREIERVSERTGTGKELRILLDGGYTDNVGGQNVSHESIAWPFEWYLRDYKNKSYYSRTFSTPTDAAVILAMVANEEPIRGSVGNYVAVRGRLNWWYPEDYKGLTWGKVWEGLRDTATRAKLWRYFLYRETLNPLGSRDFDFFVRSDLARGIPLQPAAGAAPVAQPQALPADVTVQAAPGGITVYGKTASGASVLGEPRDVALGPDGLIYVVDSASSKVVAFRPDGTVAQQWGRKGSGDGEFNEPWGIAVSSGGEVYVADTWNHRVQKFDRDGRFLAKWGTFVDVKGQSAAQAGSFWGPRDVAIAPDGKILVTDTGNKRVQLFSPEGRFLSMFGGEGSEPGKLREPVGIAVDGEGNVYVADTWNRRVQKFDLSGRPLAQFSAPGWESQSIVNKPYLAVGQEGQILYTEPEKHRFLVLDPSGRQVGARGTQGTDPAAFNVPVGIAISPLGEVFVADGRNARVVKYQSWR
ncbi:MAG: flippase activity-associated protein Agl23 [Chloroflexota bacterium]